MLFKNVYALSVISKIVFVILSFLNSILINRYLGPTFKGEYAYLLNIINIIALIINLSIAQSFPYFSRKYGSGIKQKFINIIYIQLVIYIFLGVMLLCLIKNSIWIYAIFISIVSQFNMQINFLSITTNINVKNIIGIVSVSAYSFLLFLIFTITENKLNYIIASYVIFLLFNSTLLIFINKLYPSKFSINFNLIKEIIRFSFFPMLTSLLITLNYSLDIIILKMFLDYKYLGLYSLGVTLAGMLWIIPDAFKDVLFNKTTKNDSVNHITFGIKFNVYLSIIIIVCFFFLGKIFITLFYGIEYIDSYSVTVILFIGTIPMIFFKMINTLYIAIGKQRFSFFLLLLTVISNVILNYIMIPILGIVGAAASSVLSYFICGLIILFSFKKRYNLSIKELFVFNEKEKLKIIKLIKREKG